MREVSDDWDVMAITQLKTYLPLLIQFQPSRSFSDFRHFKRSRHSSWPPYCGQECVHFIWYIVSTYDIKGLDICYVQWSSFRILLHWCVCSTVCEVMSTFRTCEVAHVGTFTQQICICCEWRCKYENDPRDLSNIASKLEWSLHRWLLFSHVTMCSLCLNYDLWGTA